MVRRFKIFRYNAEAVHRHNTYVPADPKEAAIWLKKKRQAKLLMSKRKSVSHLGDCYLPVILGPLADGGDPYLDYCDYDLLEDLEKREAHLPKDVTTK
ncbi:hypothetical protein HU200_046034 [Digitaria exilis]|uniref:Uncharacterized protein n=1 Tax=Digitaria exilis TaxID=1010633 RepID=A0A835AZ79_9POAL|nr:hypothetical protein HU200_046034 [Digitaria exilis]